MKEDKEGRRRKERKKKRDEEGDKEGGHNCVLGFINKNRPRVQ